MYKFKRVYQCTFVSTKQHDMNTTAFLLLRLGIGLSMFGHGLVRLPKLHAFSQWMVNSFKNTMLPSPLVLPFSYALPFAEFIVGFLVIAGLFTTQALIAGAAVILCLLFGTTMMENWEALPSQLIHLLFFAILLQFVQSNTYALDHLFNK
jgi:thiosulfate dehydrogenase (quinone) large subunit